jgi:hypothetical protein
VSDGVVNEEETERGREPPPPGGDSPLAGGESTENGHVYERAAFNSPPAKGEYPGHRGEGVSSLPIHTHATTNAQAIVAIRRRT